MIELSETELKRNKGNIIFLEGMNYDSDKFKKVTWKRTKIGLNIKVKKRSTCDIDSSVFSEIDLNRTKKKYVMITATKIECQNYLPSLIVSSAVRNTQPSGQVVLLLCVARNIPEGNTFWTSTDYNIIKKTKPNILAVNNHHDSKGFYASFGNKGSFDKCVSTSVGQYTTKRNKCVQKQLEITESAHSYEQRIENEISRAVMDMNSVVPKIKSIISPIIDTAFELQTSKKDINIKKVYTADSGCWQSSICVNATTGQFHTENDCTYTLISIPDQNTIQIDNQKHHYNFLFNFNEKKKMNIPLYPGVSFIFSAPFLTHRQHKNENVLSYEDHFFNIASYRNKRLLSHIKKSFNKT